MLCFRAPSVSHLLSIRGQALVVPLVVLTLALLCPWLFPILVRADSETCLALALVDGLLLIPSAYLILRICLLALGNGRIVLEQDGIVDYGYFGRPRAFSYEQVYEVRRGRFANRTLIRHYLYGEDGLIDYTRVRQARLMSVHRHVEMRRELRQRITAPRPDRKTLSRFLRRVLLGRVLLLVPFALAAIVGLVALACFPGSQRPGRPTRLTKKASASEARLRPR